MSSKIQSPPGREVDLSVATTRLIAGGIAAVKDRLVGKGDRFGSLKKPFCEYYEMVYFDMADSRAAPWRSTARSRESARSGWFLSDYPQDFTGVNT